MNYRIIIFRIFILIFSLIIITGNIKAEETEKTLIAGLEQGLKVLNDPAFRSRRKREEREQRFWDEISNIFDFKEMSKQSLGVYWKNVDLDEKTEFVELFTSVLKDGYIGKTDSYSCKKIVYLNEIKGSNRAKVQTNFITKSSKEIAVNFLLHNIADKWVIYDVVIDGVSFISNYSAQFKSILSKSSFSDLLKMMQKKVST